MDLNSIPQFQRYDTTHRLLTSDFDTIRVIKKFLKNNKELYLVKDFFLLILRMK